MKYAVIVLANHKNPLSLVDFESVTDAFLSGGVFLDEVLILPHDAPSVLSSHIARLTREFDGIFLVCESELITSAMDAVNAFGGEEKFEGAIKETEQHIFGVIPSGKAGAEIVRADVVPRIDRRRNERYCRIVLGVAVASKERVKKAVELAKQAAQGRLQLHTSGKYGCTQIEVIYNRETPKMIADEVVRILVGELKEYVYTVNGDALVERLVDSLKLHRMKVSTAESFTAGGVGGAIVSVPGASAVFFEGINAYNSRSKCERLGVKETTIQEHGAASDETAYEMAMGLLRSRNCDLAIATTGIAGPDSDESGFPKGLCYIAVGTKQRISVYRHDILGDRETVTKTAINYALFHAYEEISDNFKV